MPIANVNAPRGFSLLRQGGKAEAKRIRRAAASGRDKDLMIGDAYTLDVDGSALRLEVATDPMNGIVEGIDLNPIAASPQGPVSQDYIPAADAGAIIGIEDPDALFRVMITTIDTTMDIGKSAAIVDVDGSQALRRSRQSIVLDGTNKQVTILELLDSPADNASGAFAQVVVRLLQTL